MQTNPDSLPVEKTGRSHVLKRFSDHWATVKAMFEDNEEFRLLCNKYLMIGVYCHTIVVVEHLLLITYYSNM